MFKRAAGHRIRTVVGAIRPPAAPDATVLAGARRRRLVRALPLPVLVLFAAFGGGTAVAAPVPTSTINVQAGEYPSGTALSKFTYVINQDNVRLPNDPDPLKRTGFAPTESHSPLVAEGDDATATQTLPDGRYLISIRSPNHKMWGKHVTLPLPAADAGIVKIDMRKTPLPLGNIVALVFHDNHWVNNALDEGETGLAGFHVTLEDQTHKQVTVDYLGKPLCGGDCVTGPDGTVTIPNMGPATYFMYATPPDGQGWIQDSTFDGGFGQQVGVYEGGDGAGVPLEPLFSPPQQRTAYWFGFVKAMDWDPTQPAGTGTINGTARNWIAWPPFNELTFGDPVANAYVALSSTASDEQVWTGQADAAGNFSIPNVPAGSYTLTLWDEPLSYIIRFLPVTIAPGETIDLGDVGVSRWYGTISGEVYNDVNGNGVRDPGEAPIPNTDLDQRWRDGSIKEETRTDAFGRYEYPTAEGGPLGRVFIGEVGFARYATTGAAVHDEVTGAATHVPTDLGGGLLTNQLISEGHSMTVDWGKQVYPSGTPGQIVGITYFATTRNEFNARLQSHESYEPAIPDVTVRLEGVGPDNTPNTADDTILNQYVTDHWQHPSGCGVTGFTGAAILDLNPLIGPNCLEVPATGSETKDGAFDGGYAFHDMCPLTPAGASTYPCPDAAKVALSAGKYITHVVMPKDANGRDLYRIVKEEDVNVDLGTQFVPQIPPPPCTGDNHTVVIDPATNPRSPFNGAVMPLCDKRLVDLQNQQNANADFHMMTNFKSGPDVAVPGRIIGSVFDDINFDRDKQSIWYGEPRPVPNIPIGIRDYAGRLITTLTTSDTGGYEVLLPSTESFNCPIPQGPCPGMYVVVVNDPGDMAHPNQNFNPDYLTAKLAWDIWPGQSTQLDTPIDPISGTGCDLGTGTPELLEVSKPYVRATDAGVNRQITIMGSNLGATAGQIQLNDSRAGQPPTTLTTGNGGIVSWTNEQVVIRVPALASNPPNQFESGPKQLNIVGANGVSSTNGITIHVFGTTKSGTYNPTVVNVGPPSASPHAIQNAIDAAASAANGNPTGPGTLLVLQPGVYHENVIMHKRVFLQGLGPGGTVGAPEIQQVALDDPRYHIQGTSIDGRFFADNRTAWLAKIASLGALATVDATHPVLQGAGITVVAKTANSYPNGLLAARIDGLGIETGHGDGAGGIALQGQANNLQITNDVIAHNGGNFGGGITLGQPYSNTHNFGVKMLYDRLVGNGGMARSGGIGIYNGSNNYEVGNSTVCSNFAVEYGAGISHWGLSPGGKIHDNNVYYNESVDSGAGITISQEVPQPVNNQRVLGVSSGTVDIDRNNIDSNMSGDDGGGIFVQDALNQRINIRNNFINDNGAAHLGGAIMLDDSTNVAIVNNTVANNVSTGSAGSSDGNPHSAGLATEEHDPLFTPSGPRWSNPTALYNNIFWNNQAFTLSAPGPGATLVGRGFMDFEVLGFPNARFTPRFSLLTAAYGTGQGNIVGQNPLFVNPFVLQLGVAASRLDPQRAWVTITGADPPVGRSGNYHLQPASPAIDRGPGTNSSVAAPNNDIDLQPRPQQRTNRTNNLFDLGADEVPR